jgi:enamine deaminase RidA (YjgF/YER057c/UK114 family)
MRNGILQNNGNNVEQPFTFIQGQPYWGNGIAGVQITAIANDGNNKVSMIYENGIPIGRKWLRRGTTFIMLQSIYNSQIAEIQNANRKQQACGMFERVQKLLTEHSAAFHNVVRTWIFLADILDWYSEFNEARNSKYNEFGFFSEQPVEGETEQIYLPASTVIF